MSFKSFPCFSSKYHFCWLTSTNKRDQTDRYIWHSVTPGSHKRRLPTESQGSCTGTQASHINHNYWYLPSEEGIWQSQDWAQCLWSRWPLKELSRKPYICIKDVWEDKYKPEISSASPSFARAHVPWDSSPFGLTQKQINFQNQHQLDGNCRGFFGFKQ